MMQFSLRSRVVGEPTSTAVARQMVAMCPANGLRGLALQRVVYHTVMATPSLGLRPVHGWPLPVPLEAWQAIENRIREERGLGGGSVLWHLPPPDQPQVKFGALLLGPRGIPQVFARVLLVAQPAPVVPGTSYGSRSRVQWPTRLGLFSHDGISVEVSTTTPLGLHRPVHLDVRSVIHLCADLGEAFSGAERPAGVPGHWAPMHGDLAHWNLRRYRNGEVHLLDWEGSAWAPPHADLVRFIMTARDGARLASRLPEGFQAELDEAAQYWLEQGLKAAGEGVPAWVARKHASQVTNLSAVLGAS